MCRASTESTTSIPINSVRRLISMYYYYYFINQLGRIRDALFAECINENAISMWWTSASLIYHTQSNAHMRAPRLSHTIIENYRARLFVLYSSACVCVCVLIRAVLCSENINAIRTEQHKVGPKWVFHFIWKRDVKPISSRMACSIGNDPCVGILLLMVYGVCNVRRSCVMFNVSGISLCTKRRANVKLYAALWSREWKFSRKAQTWKYTINSLGFFFFRAMIHTRSKLRVASFCSPISFPEMARCKYSFRRTWSHSILYWRDGTNAYLRRLAHNR